MLMASMQLIFAAVIMLAQPVRHDDDGGYVRSGVASSHDVSSEQPVERSATAMADREIALPSERSKRAAPTRAAKQLVPNSNQTPRAKVATLQPAAKAAAHSDTLRATIGDLHSAAGSNGGPAARTIHEQVRAATAVPAPEQKAKNTDTEKSAASSPNDSDHLVAVLMARPEIKSVSDLAGKSVAIDIRQSASNGSVRTAIAAAGAAEVQLSGGQTTAINRVASGEVPAAVLALVSAEAAEAFPEIAGFRIFRVPLSPRALKGRPNTP
jgi:ABC-type amino acid transport substrate-binding protein